MAGFDRLEGVRQQVGQVLDDLHGLIGRVSFQASLAPDELQRDVLADLVFGTIVWSKDAGRPSTSSLFEGFSVQHQWEKIEIDSGPAGDVEHRTWIADPPPILRDGPNDETHYRVSFVDQVLGQTGEMITVELTDVGWEGLGAFVGTREVNPPTAQLPVPPNGRPVFLIFEIAIKPRIEP
jgi:hypothetical protein